MAAWMRIAATMSVHAGSSQRSCRASLPRYAAEWCCLHSAPPLSSLLYLPYHCRTLRRFAWAPGWLQREEILNAQEPGPECKACNGQGSLPCMRCSSGGVIIHI